MGEPNNRYFYDFGTLVRVPEPQHQLCLSFETPGYLKELKEDPWNIKKNCYFCTSQQLGNRHVCRFGKRQAPRNLDGPSSKLLKILNMG